MVGVAAGMGAGSIHDIFAVRGADRMRKFKYMAVGGAIGSVVGTAAGCDQAWFGGAEYSVYKKLEL